MASSLPAALTWLHQQIGGLDVIAGPPPAVVSDGWPLSRGDRMVALGITPEGDEQGVTVTYAELSRQEVETVTVRSVIACRRVGAGAAPAARADAFAIFDAIRGLVRADRRLGGAVEPGLPAQISDYTVDQTSEPKPAGDGRWCEIRWTLTWRHRD
nr:hypothetical protein [Micromonospora sp. DSM 115978]